MTLQTGETREREKISEKNREFSIFIVDDDESYLHVLGFYLKKDLRANYKIYCYSTGEECLQNLNLAPKVIILDYFLNSGTLTGLDTLKEIKRQRPKTPVVVLSSQSDFDVALDTFKSGAYTYLIKDRQALASVKKIVDTFAEKKRAKS